MDGSSRHRAGVSWRTTARAATVLLALALAAAAVACAGGRGDGPSPFDEGAASRSITIEVRNEGGGTGSTFQLYVVPSGGSARLLGSLVGRGPKRFTFAPERPRAQHRLAARASDGERTVSRPFVPEGSSGVSWEVESNHLIRR